MKIYITTILLFCSSLLAAQQTGSLTVYGKMKYRKSIVKAVDIEIIKDNRLYRETFSMKNGSFKLNLKIGHVYNIHFSKLGFVDKSVAVIAKADSTVSINGRYFFQLDIELFKEEDGEVDESILPPVAKLYIKDQTSGFTYDKKYVKWVAGRFEDELEE